MDTTTIAADTLRYDGHSADDLARHLGLPRVALYESVGSTMDAAHALAERGAPAGTLVLAEEQTAGRGRHGRVWVAGRGAGVWLTLVERPNEATGLEVLSLRVGLAAALALDRFAPATIHVKWPNDLLVANRKLAGVLVEARWRAGQPDWVAIGLGVNVRAPAAPVRAGTLCEGSSRPDLLRALVPALRAAAARHGPLDGRELSTFGARDYARGRRSVHPAEGVVVGVTSSGELAVRTPHGTRRYRSGSLVLEEDA